MGGMLSHLNANKKNVYCIYGHWIFPCRRRRRRRHSLTFALALLSELRNKRKKGTI